MRNLILLISFLFLIQSGAQADFNEAFERSFRENFRASSIRECISSAGKLISSGIDAKPICICITDKLLETSSVSELMRYIPDEKTNQIVMECIRHQKPL